MIQARQASDALGGTKMDRPEWLAIDQKAGEVYCTLTNNSSRGQPNFPGVDAANPRANNTMGGVIRWKEDGDFDGTTFKWNHLVLAGDPANARAEAKGNIKGDIFACPDGLVLDARGVLWIQTDAHATQMYKGEFQNVGNNQMLACDRTTGEIRRFLTGPTNCEITGATLTPDMTHDVHQHPAPGRNAERPQRPGRPGQVLALARLQTGRPAALGHRGDSQTRRRGDRNLGRRRAAPKPTVPPRGNAVSVGVNSQVMR